MDPGREQRHMARRWPAFDSFKGRAGARIKRTHWQNDGMDQRTCANGRRNPCILRRIGRDKRQLRVIRSNTVGRPVDRRIGQREKKQKREQAEER